MGALAALALVAACSAQPGAQATPAAQQAAVHPVSGLEIVPLSVIGQDGKKHAFRVEMAASQEAQTKGLMFRTELGPDEGMLFPSNPPTARSFWMKNTVIPLDIIFVGTDRRILNIAAGVPYELQPVFSDGATSAVLELAGGRAEALGIGPGDRVEW